MPKLRPRKGTVLILPETVGITSKLLTIPDQCKDKDLPDRGTIAAMSGIRTTKKGVKIDPEFRPGMRVLVKKFTGTLLEFEGVKYFSVPFGDVLAILE